MKGATPSKSAMRQTVSRMDITCCVCGCEQRIYRNVTLHTKRWWYSPRFERSICLPRVYRTGRAGLYFGLALVGSAHWPVQKSYHTWANSLEAGGGALGLRESNEEGADVSAFAVRLAELIVIPLRD